MVLDHHNWWVEHPQSQRPRRELWNRRCLESMWLDRIDDRQKPDPLWEEEEEVDHHLPLPEHLGGADLDEYSTASESGEGCRHRRCQQAERRLAPARLNLPIFRSTDANADVTYEIWCFNVQGRLDQYDEVSMCPHIFGSLQGYPGKWAHSLPGGMNISLNDLLRHMDCTFRNVCMIMTE